MTSRAWQMISVQLVVLAGALPLGLSRDRRGSFVGHKLLGRKKGRF